ncbi:hypothetical protein [Neoroseomonas eburnea]|uniref:hypothetical protein n=1 Tax=Neoroseomonas eburnea TaxID=1346889 RepID=UPI001BA7B784|nr:hypothetical protein [Neoroseomonas eburnea]
MAHLYADRVKELTTSTGPGSITTTGPAGADFVTFAARIGVGNTTDVCMRDKTTGEWETFRTEVLGATSLSRGAFLDSSTGSRISFAAGEKEIFCCLPAIETMRRTEIEAALAAKAPLASPVLTGTPTAPTAAPGTDTAQIATMAAVQAALVAARAANVVTVSGTTHAPALAQGGAYFRCTNAAGCAVTIPAGEDVAFPIGTMLAYEQAGVGPLTFAGDSGVAINVAATHLAATVDQHAVVQLVLVAADTWTICGNLEAA